MNSIEDRYAYQQLRLEISQDYSRFIFGAGYSHEDFDTITSEEALYLGGIICKRIMARVLAAAKPLKAIYGDEDILDFLAKMSDRDKKELRNAIDFRQPQYATKS